MSDLESDWCSRTGSKFPVFAKKNGTGNEARKTGNADFLKVIELVTSILYVPMKAK